MHKFIRTSIEHHDDGSATVDHEHADKNCSVKHAVEDLDAIHDSLEDYLREHEQEDDAEEEIHPGIHDEIEKKHPEIEDEE
jgi:hypothetical protein